jgi:ferredoxin
MNDVAAGHLLEVDRVKCCGYGMCAETSPALFSLDEGGLVVANMAEVPDDLLESAEEAAYLCPAEAILVRKAHG